MQRNFDIRSKRRVFSLIVIGIFVHILILKGALDVYFSSPIDHGMNPVISTLNPPAKRLVFMVADGLRAEAIFSANNTKNAPFLNGIRKKRGSWGISHTRVPTESRPGHVAMLAGIYEDPSAILKGWQSNPVDFDSVINQSTNAWCWGGPSIINMFNKDLSPHIHLHSYSPQLEDFGNPNTTGLDAWVFQHVQEFLEEKTRCEACLDYKQEGNIFFLHLLGIDTAGHSIKPNSLAYMENVKYVDQGIRKMEILFETAFPDGKTAYVFTADHGMTNWGSHGSGSEHETNTPLIAWGAGVRVDSKRKDVEQIDLAPLLAALIGTNYPLNSLGRLPTDYINADYNTLADMTISNVLQLLEIFFIKRNRIMLTAFNFVEYQGATPKDIELRVSYLKNLALRRNFQQLKVQCHDFIKLLVKAADYYHNYYQLPLFISISAGIVGWIIYLATFNIHIKKNILENRKEPKWGESLKHVLYFLPMYLQIFVACFIQQMPLMFYIYFCFPVVMANVVTSCQKHLLEMLKQLNRFGFKKTLYLALIYTYGLSILIQSFQDRESVSIALYLMAAFVYISNQLSGLLQTVYKYYWILACCWLSIFPFSPVMETHFDEYVYLFGFACWWVVFKTVIMPHMESDIANFTVSLQFFMFILTPLYTFMLEKNIIDSNSEYKLFAWFWAAIPILAIPYSSPRIYSRLTSIFLGFGTFYLMVTKNYEVMFLLSYIALLYTWILIESRCFRYYSVIKKTFVREIYDDVQLQSDDFRRAFFFITIIFVGFFGTGNIASLNSFDPMWTRAFITDFSPFTMTAIILLRIMVPFLFASCVYRAVNLFRKGNTFNMFCIVLMFSDIMLLELLFSITNIGSWLEIGMTLSQFIIMETFVVMLLVLYGCANLLTTIVLD